VPLTRVNITAREAPLGTAVSSLMSRPLHHETASACSPASVISFVVCDSIFLSFQYPHYENVSRMRARSIHFVTGGILGSNG
jgi:hypothetical protein